MLLMKQMHTRQNATLLRGLTNTKFPTQDKHNYKIEVESMTNTQLTNSSSAGDDTHTFRIKDMKSNPAFSNLPVF